MFKFERNMGAADRSARLIVGVTLLVVGPATDIVATDALSNILMGGLALMAVGSAALAHCVLYNVTGFNTES